MELRSRGAARVARHRGLPTAPVPTALGVPVPGTLVAAIPTTLVVLALAALAAFRPLPASAQENGWVVGSNQVTAVVPATGADVSVTVRMSLVPADAAAPVAGAALPLELLAFGDVTISDLRRDDGSRVLLWPASGRRLAASVGPPFATEGGAPFVELRYVVRGAVTGEGADRHVRVPMLSGPVRPTGGEEDPSGAGAFASTVTVPQGWRLRESFPSGLAYGGDGPDHDVDLPVTPAMISFRASTDGSRRPGFPVLVDGLTVLLLLGFAAFGWRHLRSVVAGRRATREPVG